MSSSLSQSESANRIDVLDGWRALSITLVLIGHWFPFPRITQINDAAAASGMALFFVLSGFLITRLLLKDARPAPFMARRIFRIVPLAWLAMAILVIWNRPTWDVALANFLFYANLPPARLMPGGAHLWSLCVEVQFYLFCAMAVWVAGRKAIFFLPVLALAVTAIRVTDAVPISIHTWYRVDEILAGAIVALLYSTRIIGEWARFVPRYACLVALALLFLSAHPETGGLAYLRPYFAALTVGLSLLAVPAWARTLLTSGPARYVAETSYALYVVHGVLGATPLGGADAPKPVRYALRIPLVGATFLLAHLSTRYFEKPFTDLGKRLATRSHGGAIKPVSDPST